MDAFSSSTSSAPYHPATRIPFSQYLHDVQKIWLGNDPLSLEKVEGLAFAANLGNWIPMAGILYDSQFGGPRNVIWVACALTLIGYGGLWYTSVHVPEGNYSEGERIWLLRLLWFAWGHGSGYFDCACIATTACNFPRERGTAMGVVKALYGLSGALLAQPYLCFFSGPGHAPDFLLFLAVSLPVMGLLASPFVHSLKFTSAMMEADRPATRLRIAFGLILILAIILAAAGVLRSVGDGSTALSYAVLCVSLVGILALLSIAWGASVRKAGESSTSLLRAQGPDTDVANPADLQRPINEACFAAPACADHPAGHPSAATSVSGNTSTSIDIDVAVACAAAPDSAHAQQEPRQQLTGTEVEQAGDSTMPTAPLPRSDGTVWENLRSVEFWLLFFTFFAGTGGGLVITNHIEFIVLAQFGTGRKGDAKRVSDSLISLFSVFNSLGRLGAGLGSDVARGCIHRPTFFAAAAAVMGLSHVLLLGANVTLLLYAAIACGGTAYGAFWSLCPTIIGELFGLKAFASTYNAYTPAVSGASLLLSATLASCVAEAHTQPAPPAPPGMPPPPPPPCLGALCYRDTHLVLISLCAVGVVTSLAVSWRTRHYYHNRNLQEKAAAAAAQPR